MGKIFEIQAYFGVKLSKSTLRELSPSRPWRRSWLLRRFRRGRHHRLYPARGQRANVDSPKPIVITFFTIFVKSQKCTDVDAYDYWKEKFKARPQLEVYISDYLQKNATEEDLNSHIDIADRLIHWKQAPDTMTLPADTPIQPKQQVRLEFILSELRQYWSEETVQAAAPPIDDLKFDSIMSINLHLFYFFLFM